MDLVTKAKSLTKDGDMISGDLTDEAVKELMTFGGGRRRDGSEAPAPENAKGSVKFWVKEGALTKVEYHVEGTLSFNGNTMDLKRTTTTEIKDAGKVTVEVPEEAKKKIESAPKPQPNRDMKSSIALNLVWAGVAAGAFYGGMQMRSSEGAAGAGGVRNKVVSAQPATGPGGVSTAKDASKLASSDPSVIDFFKKYGLDTGIPLTPDVMKEAIAEAVRENNPVKSQMMFARLMEALTPEGRGLRNRRY